MPAGITAIISAGVWKEEKRTPARKTQEERASVASKKKDSYFIVRDLEGERHYEGRLDSVVRRYKISVKEFRELIQLKEPLPGGFTYQHVFDKDRPMERVFIIYSVYEGESLIISGKHKEVIEEMGLFPSQLTTMTKKLQGGKYTVMKEKKWLPV